MAMITLDWFNPGEVVRISTSEWQSPDSLALLGMSPGAGFDGNIGVSALMDGAETGLIFPRNSTGAKATGGVGDVMFTAAKYGAAGNKLSIQISEQGTAHRVTTFFSGVPVDSQIISNISEFTGNRFIMPEVTIGSGEAPETVIIMNGEAKFDGGDSGTIPSYSERAAVFQSAASIETWDVIAFSIDPEESGYTSAVAAFIEWLNVTNEEQQEARHAVIFNYTDLSSDNYDVTNIRQTCRFDGELLSPSEMCLWVASLSAGAAANHSMTADRLRRASDLQPRYNAQNREEYMNRGFWLLHEDQNGVITVVRDNNSFVSTSLDFNIQWTDNRSMRTRHAWMIGVSNIFDTEFKGAVADTAEGRTLFRVACDRLATAFEEVEMFAEHDISKIAVVSGAFRTWGADYEPAVIPTAVDTLDFRTRITW